MTWRFGKPQKSSNFGQDTSRCSLHTRNSGTRWSTSALFHSRLPVWPQRRACRRRRRAASPLGAFQNSQAITQAQVPVGILVSAAVPQIDMPAEAINGLAAHAAEAGTLREGVLSIWRGRRSECDRQTAFAIATELPLP